ncbi:fungal-specific transcription factor domain-containing protein [Xylogone sp. PMI_703]|nr:fungal-specific transcription factor domain-containing protein [Xylogone sp. PMI_703]
MTTRSHHGCARCKRRRQKCDEKRPSCGRCAQADSSCEYLINLKWNGRVPRRLSVSRTKKGSGFIEQKIPDLEDYTPLPPDQEPRPATAEPMHILELDPLDALPSREKALLHHFVTNTSRIASHAHIREQACRQILSMALQIPSLMYATMALSALHQSTLLNGVPDHFIPEEVVRDLSCMSLRHLRRELQSNDANIREYLLNTVRTLCVCEIYSGKADSSWRIHVDGARAILESLQQTQDKYIKEEPRNWLIARWYESMEALSALTNQYSLKVNAEGGGATKVVTSTIAENEYALDIYAGYSSDLNLILREIGILEWRFRYCSEKGGSNSSSSQKTLQTEARRLEDIVWRMIHRDRDEGLKISTALVLNNDEIRQFSACNTAYQYSALIHIYRRLCKMDSNSTNVQTCVRRILDAVCGVLPILPLSPWALLTTPIFTAGCEAVGEDRDLVKDLLLKLYNTLRIRNIYRAINILEGRWNRPISEVNDTDLLMDFLPY